MSRHARRGSALLPAAMPQSDMAKRLMWSGLLAGLGALASVATQRVATTIWQRMFGEDPPE
jgi:hypothetical protein